MTRILGLAAAAAALFAVQPAAAHHSYAMFDSQKDLALEGTVETFKWSNPHSFIEFLVTNKDGKSEKWTAECGSPAQMVRAGWRSSTLKPGDHVVVTIHPLRSGEFGGSFVSVEAPDGRVLKGS